MLVCGRLSGCYLRREKTVPDELEHVEEGALGVGDLVSSSRRRTGHGGRNN